MVTRMKRCCFHGRNEYISNGAASGMISLSKLLWPTNDQLMAHRKPISTVFDTSLYGDVPLIEARMPNSPESIDMLINNSANINANGLNAPSCTTTISMLSSIYWSIHNHTFTINTTLYTHHYLLPGHSYNWYGSTIASMSRMDTREIMFHWDLVASE